MERDDGLRILTQRGWLSGTPAAFQRAMLTGCHWRPVEAGALIQVGDEEVGELIGLASGIIELTTVLGAPDTPLMHLEHPVFWFGYMPILFREPRRIRIAAKTPVWLASISHPTVKRVLEDRPPWWQHLLPLALTYGNTSATVAADLLIRDSERRCAAVLLRLGGRRFAGPDDAMPIEVPVTQDELAAAASLSRNTVGDMLRKLAARGMIELGYRGIMLRATRALRGFADGQ